MPADVCVPILAMPAHHNMVPALQYYHRPRMPTDARVVGDSVWVGDGGWGNLPPGRPTRGWGLYGLEDNLEDK